MGIGSQIAPLVECSAASPAIPALHALGESGGVYRNQGAEATDRPTEKGLWESVTRPDAGRRIASEKAKLHSSIRLVDAVLESGLPECNDIEEALGAYRLDILGGVRCRP